MLAARAIGRLVSEPQLREIKVSEDKTVKVCEFRLACQQRGEEVDFVKVSAWRGLGDFIFKHVEKGQKVFIEGKLKIPPFSKEKGRAYEPFIVAYTFEFCDSKKKPTAEQPPQDEQQPGDDDLMDTFTEDDFNSFIPE